MKTLQIGDSSKEIPCGTSSSTRDDWKFLDIRSGDIGQINELREAKEHCGDPYLVWFDP